MYTTCNNYTLIFFINQGGKRIFNKNSENKKIFLVIFYFQKNCKILLLYNCHQNIV